MPEGVSGAVVTGSSATNEEGISLLNLSYDYQPGNLVPAQTALLVKGEPGNYEFSYSNEATVFSGDNWLKGQMTNGLIEGAAGTKYYKLTYSLENDVKTLGFFYGAAGGAPFVTGAGKAYLAIPASAAEARGFLIDWNPQTAIEEARKQTEAPAVYTLDGRRLSPATLRLNKGVYIRGGRKVVVK